MAHEPKKRATYGDGTVRTRKDGLLEKRIRLGVDSTTGRYIRKSVYGRTLKELQVAARKAEAEHRAGLHAAARNRGTLTDYFEHEHDGWLTLKAREIGARTLRNYWNDWERYILPGLGAKRLTPEDLSVPVVTRWHADVAKNHGAYTANRARDLLRNALNDSSLRAQNPAGLVRAAKHAKRPVEILTAGELALFVAATKRSRLRNMFLVALTTGLRHGEASALHWADVTLYPTPKTGADHGELRVRRAVVTTDDGLEVAPTPKTDSGYRTIGLSPEAASALKDQRAQLNIEGLANSRLVFPNGAGGIQAVENTGRALRGVLDACNPRLMEWIHERRSELRSYGRTVAQARQQAWKEAQALPEFHDLIDCKYVSFHDLRHTFASMMIAAGMDAPTLARVLGHSDPAFTMRTYVHFFERQQRRPMPSVTSLVPGLDEHWG